MVWRLWTGNAWWWCPQKRGFHSEANMKMLEGKEINGYVADRNMEMRSNSPGDWIGRAGPRALTGLLPCANIPTLSLFFIENRGDHIP